MQLEMAAVSLQSPHFDDTRLFQVVQPQLFVLKVIHVLNNFRQSVDDVHQIIALVKNKIDVFASIRKLRGDALLHNADHKIRVRLVAHFVHILFRYFVEASRCSLKVVESVPHVTLSGEYQSLVALIFNFKALSFDDKNEPLKHFFIRQLREPDDCAPGLDWFYELRGVIASEGKSSSV